jgi:hypothetical protein
VIPELRAFLIACIPWNDLDDTLKLAIVLITGLLNLLFSSSIYLLIISKLIKKYVRICLRRVRG